MTGPRLAELRLKAGVTNKEWDALRLYDHGRVGYRSVALALDIAPSTAQDRIARALRKLSALEEL